MRRHIHGARSCGRLLGRGGTDGPPRQPEQEDAADQAEDLPRVHQRVRDGPQPERGDRPVCGIGCRDAQARNQSVTRPWASVRRMTSRLIGPTAAAIVKPRTKPRSASAGSTGSPFGDEKTPSASAAGASRAGGRRPSGARGQVEVARVGPCWDRVVRRFACITAQGGGFAWPLSTGPRRRRLPATEPPGTAGPRQRRDRRLCGTNRPAGVRGGLDSFADCQARPRLALPRTATLRR